MGVHAFVARSGWQTTPISVDEWHAAAAAVPALELHRADRNAPQRAVLRHDRRRGLVLRHGCLHADRVDRHLAAELFALAPLLDAQVFSARRRPYRDLAEWELRNARRSRRAAAEGGGVPGRRRVATADAVAVAWMAFGATAFVLGSLAAWAFA